MSSAIASANSAPPCAYRQLVQSQNRTVCTLTAAILIPYATFIAIAAFAPGLLALKLAPISVINVAWPLGVVFIVSSWLLTGLYIRRANTRFDRLLDAVHEEALS
ncbi:DUF485 domain-containing protein [Pseudomonas machongensis]